MNSFTLERDFDELQMFYAQVLYQFLYRFQTGRDFNFDLHMDMEISYLKYLILLDETINSFKI